MSPFAHLVKLAGKMLRGRRFVWPTGRDPERYRQYMRRYMRKYRAKQ